MTDRNQPSDQRENVLQTTAQREVALLAPWAMFSHQSAGREVREEEHPYRGPFQRDRDRILHSSAYRRLSGKMQVFTGEMGDYHRTRLTHTQEVASIARTIGRALRLNEDLIEALALFHDIGHPPYGHAGEDALDECLAEEGGFSHNHYALTIAQQLEHRHTDLPGLNLCREVLDSQAYRIDKEETRHAPLLEAQVVDAADSITYDAHDTDDAVKLGLVSLEELDSLALIRRCLEAMDDHGRPCDPHNLRRGIVHQLIDCQVSQLLETTREALAQFNWRSAEEARHGDFQLQLSGSLADEKAELEGFLYEHVYRHPQLLQTRDIARQQIHLLFQHFQSHPDILPPRFQRRAESVGISRAVGDYLAGMTDRYLESCFLKHFPTGNC